jgi:hypothetical protein
MKTRPVFLFVFLVFITSIVIGSCGDDSTVEPKRGKPVIFPLAKGNIWHYDNPPGFPSATSYIEITGDTTVMVDTLAYDVFNMVWEGALSADATTLYVRNEADGFWNLGTACTSDTLTFRNMVAMYPAAVDSTWTKIWTYCASGITGIGPGTAECTHVDTLYTAPAGTFSCYRYRETYNSPGGTIYFYLYMAPNVGIVAIEVDLGGQAAKIVLNSYTLK